MVHISTAILENLIVIWFYSRGLITKFRSFIFFLHYVADPNKRGIGNYLK